MFLQNWSIKLRLSLQFWCNLRAEGSTLYHIQTYTVHVTVKKPEPVLILRLGQLYKYEMFTSSV